ncbi:unnamed protein product [Microthlaspi erraticum]|uniref:Uncharacterized protein n=1 Tax=Microthlaspi erraticum TaxID=1685480 RepID=A0A6D2J7W5_9BRAS|nr:unnamed protein product [Microthlaspi erraticum]
MSDQSKRLSHHIRLCHLLVHLCLLRFLFRFDQLLVHCFSRTQTRKLPQPSDGAVPRGGCSNSRYCLHSSDSKVQQVERGMEHGLFRSWKKTKKVKASMGAMLCLFQLGMEEDMRSLTSG